MSKPQGLRPKWYPPVTVAGDLPDFGSGVAAIEFYNAGDSVVSFENGSRTLQPLASFIFNVTECNAELVLDQISITFVGGATNKLEITALILC